LNSPITLSILIKILAISFPLSRFLQKEFLETASTVQKNIQGIRENCVIEFEKIDIPVSLTRQNKRQHSNNVSPHSFIKHQFLNPFLNNYSDKLNERFLLHECV